MLKKGYYIIRAGEAVEGPYKTVQQALSKFVKLVRYLTDIIDFNTSDDYHLVFFNGKLYEPVKKNQDEVTAKYILQRQDMDAETLLI